MSTLFCKYTGKKCLKAQVIKILMFNSYKLETFLSHNNTKPPLKKEP